MKKHLLRLAAGVGIAGLFATMAPLSAFAAATPTYDPTTDAPIYLVNMTTGEEYTAGTQMAWNVADGVFLSGIPMSQFAGDEEALRLPAPTNGAVTVQQFISPVGSERTRASWKSWATTSSTLGGVGSLEASVWPGYLGAGDPNGVKTAGGTYSMGIAYLKNSDQTVVSAYYTTINVDAGTGTWTFATKPADVIVTDVPTTTTVSATPTSVEAGQTTTLTANVAATGKTVTGNVEFFEGTTSLGTVGLSSGSASKIVTVGTPGTHTYSAKFVENTVGTDKFLASASADVTVTGTVPAVPVPPNAAGEEALNVNSKHGATATYDEATHKATLNVDAVNEGKTVNVIAYSTPKFLGQLVVTGGKVTVDVSTLAAGTHKLSIADPNTGDVLAWADFIKSDAAISPSFSKTIDADVAALAPSDGEFSLINTSGASVHLTNPVIVGGQSVVSGELGTFKVTDLRQVSKPGWKLSTNVADFTKGTDTIAKSALGIAPKVVSQAGSGATAPTLGTALVSGSATYPWDFATLAGGAFSGVSTYNADLVFTAPAGKPAGTYSSTITLTLVSN
jgi:hypothetical protein